MTDYSSMPTAELTSLVARLEDELCALDMEDGAVEFAWERRRGWKQDYDAVVAQLRDAQAEHDSRWMAEQYKPRLYRCEGFRSVTALDVGEAAEIFANRWARRQYGKRGFCYKARLDSWGGKGGFHNYECFVGVPEGNGCTGRNIWLTVYPA